MDSFHSIHINIHFFIIIIILPYLYIYSYPIAISLLFLETFFSFFVIFYFYHFGKSQNLLKKFLVFLQSYMNFYLHLLLSKIYLFSLLYIYLSFQISKICIFLDQSFLLLNSSNVEILSLYPSIIFKIFCFPPEFVIFIYQKSFCIISYIFNKWSVFNCIYNSTNYK